MVEKGTPTKTPTRTRWAMVRNQSKIKTKFWTLPSGHTGNPRAKLNMTILQRNSGWLMKKVEKEL